MAKLGYRYDQVEETYKRPLYQQYFDKVSKVLYTEFQPANETFYLNIHTEYHGIFDGKDLITERVRVPLQIKNEIDHAVIIKLLSLPTEKGKN